MFEPIREDIALEELAMFRKEAKFAPTFRTSQASSMIVNLFGNVNGRFKTGSPNKNETHKLEHDAQIRKNQEQTHELMYLLDKARNVAGRLVQNSQRDLFDEN